MAGGNIQYFLVGQNKFNHQFQIIEFYPEDYLYDTHRKLEQLDLFSSSFQTEEELVQFLYDKGRLPNCDYHMSIAFLKDRDVKFYNPIYNDGHNKHLSELRESAQESLQDTKKSIKHGKKIIKDFFEKVKTEDKLYSMIVSNTTNIYGKFLDYFKTKGKFENFSDLQSMDGAWFLRSYTLLRNIVDVESHYERLSKSSSDFYRAMIEEKQVDDRRKLKGKNILRKEILEKVDPLVLPGQLSLFDFNMDSGQYSFSRKSPTGVILKNDIKEPKQIIPVGITKKKKTTIPDYSEISDSKKRAAIFSTLRSITKNPFRIGEYNNVEFNPNCFPFPISSEQQEKLEKYMDRRTQKNCYYYIRYNSMIEEENKKGFSVCYELYEDRDAEARSLRTKFKNPTTLNKAYAWCVVFNECLVQQQEYNEDQSSNDPFENGGSGAYVKKRNGENNS